MGNTLDNHGELERARYAPESEEQEKEPKSFVAAKMDRHLRGFSEADDGGSEYGIQRKLHSWKNKADKFGQLIAHAFVTKHDAAHSYHWENPDGIALEKIGMWLQRRGWF
uniref:Uncharacterized protein n=1 Tax=Ixodes ricinus TaxID=34613 RepID=V5IG68_IXORI